MAKKIFLMAYNSEKIRLLFGLKIKQLRIDKGLSLNEVAQKAGLSVSYLNEIEKGKKHPKSEKIMALATALATDYDTLVSLKLSKKLEPISELLETNILSELPLDMFGIEPASLLELMSAAPTKLSAFVSTIIEICRSHKMGVEQFYFSVLRSYQEMHDNYFEDLEAAADQFLKSFHPAQNRPISAEWLEGFLTTQFDYKLEEYDQHSQPELISLRSVYIPKKNKLLINKELGSEQRIFTLAREVGYQYMKIKNRPLMSTAIEVNSFDEVLNNFKASYFARAILMNRQVMIRKLEDFFNRKHWNGDAFLAMIQTFNVTPEMLLHRVSNLMTSHFGIKQLFFLRFNNKPGENRFYLTKEMHLAKLHNPHATLGEFYCRRWVALTSLQTLAKLQTDGTWEGDPLCHAQISTYIDSGSEYLVISLAKPSPPSTNNSSVTLGFAIDDQLRKVVSFLKDPALPKRNVSESCERCPATDCQERMRSPYLLEKRIQKETLMAKLAEVLG